MEKKSYWNHGSFVFNIVPRPGCEEEADENGFFDDCPICREMKKDLEEGVLEKYEQDLEDNNH